MVLRLHGILLLVAGTMWTTPHGLGASDAASAPLTYDAALEMALAQSIDAQRAALAVDLASADLAVTQYENDMQLQLAGNWGDYRPRAPDTGDLFGKAAPQSTASPTSAGSVLAKDQAYSVGISRPLLDFGRHSTRLDQGRYQVEIKTLARAEVTEALRYRVARTYAAVAASDRVVHITTDTIRVFEKKLKDITTNYRAGLRPESDVVTAQVDLGKAKITLATASDAARSTRLALGLLMGKPDAAVGAILPPAALAPPSAEKWRTVAANWQDFARSATATRRAKELAALSADEDLVHAVKRPVLTGSLAAAVGGPWVGPEVSVYTGALALTWIVPWNGMERDELRRIGLKHQDYELQDALDLRARHDKDASGHDTFQAASNQYEQEQAQEKLTVRQLDLVQRRYETGKATALEVSTVESDLLTTRLESVRLYNAMANALLDIAEARVVTDVGALFR